MPLLHTIAGRRGIKGFAGELIATVTDDSLSLPRKISKLSPPVPLKEAYRNSTVVYDDKLLLKLFRRQEAGTNPDLEIRRFLSEKHYAQHIAPLAGTLEYHRPSRGSIAVGLLQVYIPDVRNSLAYTLDSLRDFYERVVTQQDDMEVVPVPSESLLELQEMQPTALANQAIGTYLTNVELLGRSTADLHLVLASDPLHPSFAPEPFTTLYQRSIYQSARNLTGQTFRTLSQRLRTLPEEVKPLAHKVLDHKEDVMQHFRQILDQKNHGFTHSLPWRLPSAPGALQR